MQWQAASCADPITPDTVRRHHTMTATTSWVQQLAGTPLSERGSALEALVTAEFRTWLLMDDSDTLPLDESYFALGLTSLGATEIQQRLETALGRHIDSTSLFNNPTVGHLLSHLRAEVLPELFAHTRTQPPVSSPAPAAQPPFSQLWGSAPGIRSGDRSKTTRRRL